MVIPSLTDPMLAPPGHHVVIVQGDTPRESGATPRGEARVADRLLSFAEQARTPANRLLAGQSTRPAHGIFAVMESGIRRSPGPQPTDRRTNGRPRDSQGH